MKEPFLLSGVTQKYDWGGSGFISKLIYPRQAASQIAEYWLGIHSKGPAMATNEHSTTSLASIAPDLSFLFKILDVAKPLSIQVHPNSKQAEAGFSYENTQGVAIADTKRNYKDSNAKPELAIALSDFWLLHGFLPKQQLQDNLAEFDEFADLLAIYNQDGLQRLYAAMMTMPQEKVNTLLTPIIHQLIARHAQSKFSKGSSYYWIVTVYLQSGGVHIDRGIFAFFICNIVHLKPGESIFQPAGMLHSYLEGKSIEVMTNSDNVLRGGLTKKHINIDELLKIVLYQPTTPKLLTWHDASDLSSTLDSATPEFSVARVSSNKAQTYHKKIHQNTIIFVISGELQISTYQENNLTAGQALYFAPKSNLTASFIQPGEFYIVEQHV